MLYAHTSAAYLHMYLMWFTTGTLEGYIQCFINDSLSCDEHLDKFYV